MPRKHDDLVDEQTRNERVLKFVRLVWKIVNRLWGSNYLVRRMDREDAAQSGFLGLLRAASLFDPSYGVKEITYYTVAITNSILRASMSQDLVKIPVHKYGEYMRSGELPPSCTNLGEHNLQDFVKDERLINVDPMLEKLTPDESDLIRKYFGIGTSQMTCSHIAKRKGVDRQRIVRMKKKILNKISAKNGCDKESEEVIRIKAFNQGSDACIAKKDRTENPYHPKKQKIGFMYWRRGWNHVRDLWGVDKKKVTCHGN